MESVDKWLGALAGALNEGSGWPAKLALSFLAIVALWLLRRLLVGVVEIRDVEAQSRYRWRKMTAWMTGLASILVVSFIWMDQFRSLTTFLGLLSAGLAIALKDFVAGIAGWLYIVIRAPFTAGDRIEIAGVSGDVIDVRLFKFTLMEIGNWVDADQSTGRVVHVPNGFVISSTLFNYSRGFHYIWNEIPILVTFESNWKKARDLLLEIVEKETHGFTDEAASTLEKAAKRYYLYFTHLTPIVYTRIADSGVLLTIRHICPPRRRRGVGDALAQAILQRFAEHDDIDLAYPTTRYYDHTREGKPELRPRE
ncbi:MAG: mechanosensitive ion channel family protein [Thermoanaerobaculia bacterium]|nr:mechanosensitive ion channel family protein [Thermoanaerobaculia bacterium]